MCGTCGGTCGGSNPGSGNWGGVQMKKSTLTFPNFKLDNNAGYIEIGHYKSGPFCFLQVPTISGVVTQDVDSFEVTGGNVFWPPCRTVYQVVMMVINSVPLLGYFRISQDKSVSFHFYPFNGTSIEQFTNSQQSRCRTRIPAGTTISIRGLGQSWFHGF